MACDSITDIVVRESGRYLTDEIFKRAFTISPWFTLMRRGAWPDAMGATISNLTYERSAPTDANPTWTQINPVDGGIVEGGDCLPTVTKVGIGSTTRTFSLYRQVLEGPDFCVESMRSAFELTEQLNKVAGVLAERTRLEWEIHNRNEYFANVKHKVVVDGTSPTSTSTIAATYPASEPTSILDPAVLDQ